MDFKNAFNSISRQCALESFRRILPTLISFVKSIYGQNSKLWFITSDFQPDYILSQEGSQQGEGDPLGPSFFAMGILPLLRKLQPHLDHLQAYVDDLTLFSTYDKNITALNLLIQEAPNYGLTINYKNSISCYNSVNQIKSPNPGKHHIWCYVRVY